MLVDLDEGNRPVLPERQPSLDSSPTPRDAQATFAGRGLAGAARRDAVATYTFATVWRHASCELRSRCRISIDACLLVGETYGSRQSAS